jgi:hypothetical protein
MIFTKATAGAYSVRSPVNTFTAVARLSSSSCPRCPLSRRYPVLPDRYWCLVQDTGYGHCREPRQVPVDGDAAPRQGSAPALLPPSGLRSCPGHRPAAIAVIALRLFPAYRPANKAQSLRREYALDMPFHRATAKHSERCRDCKQRVEQLLKAVYGGVRRNWPLGTSATPESYEGTTAYETLKFVYESLQKQRGHESFVMRKLLPNCDFLVPASPSFIVEFDESQHFTASRRLSLRLYPNDGFYGFDRSRWMELCVRINARDNFPHFRDEQRAWYDTLRDLVPATLGMRPTVRLYAGECQWCALNATDPEDLSTFRRIIGDQVRRRIF